MISYWMPLAFALLANASPLSASEQGLVMNSIERTVRLPSGALPFEQYARFYALDNEGKVIGLYVQPYEPEGPCRGYNERSHKYYPVKCPTNYLGLKAGQRRWVGNRSDLAMFADGGCTVVTIVYDRKRELIESATCNGFA